MDLWQWLPRDLRLCFSTWDCTFKSLEAAKGEPDCVAGHLWAVPEGAAALYLLPWEFHKQVGVTDTIEGILSCETWARNQGLPLSGIYIEDKANGPAVIELMRQHVPGVQPWPGDNEDWSKIARGSKSSRAHAASAYVNAGNVHLPSPDRAPWIDQWLAEVESFPHGSFDDRVDGLSMACAIAFLNPSARAGDGYWAGLKALRGR